MRLSCKLQGGTRVCDCQNLNGQRTDGLVCAYLMQYLEKAPPAYPFLERYKGELTGRGKSGPLAEINAQIAGRHSEMGGLVGRLSQPDRGQALVKQVNARVGSFPSSWSSLLPRKSGWRKAGSRLHTSNRSTLQMPSPA